MRKALILITILLAINSCPAQSQWSGIVRRVGGEFALSTIQTTDGGYVMAGTTYSTSLAMYIVKLTAAGALQWSKIIGGASDLGAYSIVQTSDGGYAVAGYTSSFGAGGGDMYIVKLDSTGSLQWSKTVGGTADEFGLSIIQTTNGGYVAVGWTSSFGAGGHDMYIVKLNSGGSLQWSKTIGSTLYDEARSIIQTSDGGFAIAGLTSFGAGTEDYYIVKLDSGGALQWSKTVGGPSYDEARSIIQTTDGGYAVAGRTQTYGAGGDDMYIVKLSSNGGLLWTRSVGGPLEDLAYSIIQTTDGGYAVGGYEGSFGGGFSDVYIVKLEANGNLMWSKTTGGTYNEYGYSIMHTTDGGYAVGGASTSFGPGNYAMYIVKFDNNWNTCGNTGSPSSISDTGGVLGSPGSIVTSPTSIVTTPTPTVSTGGTVTNICLTGIQPISNEAPSGFSLGQNYPNPFNPNTKIKFSIPKSLFTKLTIYDVTGRVSAILVNGNLRAGTYEVDWDAGIYPSGVYFYALVAVNTMTGKAFNESRKLILIK